MVGLVVGAAVGGAVVGLGAAAGVLGVVVGLVVGAAVVGLGVAAGVLGAEVGLVVGAVVGAGVVGAAAPPVYLAPVSIVWSGTIPSTFSSSTQLHYTISLLLGYLDIDDGARRGSETEGDGGSEGTTTRGRDGPVSPVSIESERREGSHDCIFQFNFGC